MNENTEPTKAAPAKKAAARQPAATDRRLDLLQARFSRLERLIALSLGSGAGPDPTALPDLSKEFQQLLRELRQDVLS